MAYTLQLGKLFNTTTNEYVSGYYYDLAPEVIDQIYCHKWIYYDNGSPIIVKNYACLNLNNSGYTWYYFNSGNLNLLNNGVYRNTFLQDNLFYCLSGGSGNFLSGIYCNLTVQDNKFYYYENGNRICSINGYYYNLLNDNKCYYFNDGFFSNVDGIKCINNNYYCFIDGVNRGEISDEYKYCCIFLNQKIVIQNNLDKFRYETGYLYLSCDSLYTPPNCICLNSNYELSNTSVQIMLNTDSFHPENIYCVYKKPFLYGQYLDFCVFKKITNGNFYGPAYMPDNFTTNIVECNDHSEITDGYEYLTPDMATSQAILVDFSGTVLYPYNTCDYKEFAKSGFYHFDENGKYFPYSGIFKLKITLKSIINKIIPDVENRVDQILNSCSVTCVQTAYYPHVVDDYNSIYESFYCEQNYCRESKLVLTPIITSIPFLDRVNNSEFCNCFFGFLVFNKNRCMWEICEHLPTTKWKEFLIQSPCYQEFASKFNNINFEFNLPRECYSSFSNIYVCDKCFVTIPAKFPTASQYMSLSGDPELSNFCNFGVERMVLLDTGIYAIYPDCSYLIGDECTSENNKIFYSGGILNKNKTGILLRKCNTVFNDGNSIELINKNYNEHKREFDKIRGFKNSILEFNPNYNGKTNYCCINNSYTGKLNSTYPISVHKLPIYKEINPICFKDLLLKGNEFVFPEDRIMDIENIPEKYTPFYDCRVYFRNNISVDFLTDDCVSYLNQDFQKFDQDPFNMKPFLRCSHVEVTGSELLNYKNTYGLPFIYGMDYELSLFDKNFKKPINSKHKYDISFCCQYNPYDTNASAIYWTFDTQENGYCCTGSFLGYAYEYSCCCVTHPTAHAVDCAVIQYFHIQDEIENIYFTNFYKKAADLKCLNLYLYSLRNEQAFDCEILLCIDNEFISGYDSLGRPFQLVSNGYETYGKDEPNFYSLYQENCICNRKTLYVNDIHKHTPCPEIIYIDKYFNFEYKKYPVKSFSYISDCTEIELCNCVEIFNKEKNNFKYQYVRADLDWNVDTDSMYILQSKYDCKIDDVYLLNNLYTKSVNIFLCKNYIDLCKPEFNSSVTGIGNFNIHYNEYYYKILYDNMNCNICLNIDYLKKYLNDKYYYYGTGILYLDYYYTARSIIDCNNSQLAYNTYDLNTSYSLYKINSICENYINEYLISAFEYDPFRYCNLDCNTLISSSDKFLDINNSGFYRKKSKDIYIPIIKCLEYRVSTEYDILKIQWYNYEDSQYYRFYIESPATSYRLFSFEVKRSDILYDINSNLFMYDYKIDKENRQVGTYTVNLASSSESYDVCGDYMNFRNYTSRSINVLNY